MDFGRAENADPRLVPCVRNFLCKSDDGRGARLLPPLRGSYSVIAIRGDGAR
jgi:hypothetical protein